MEKALERREAVWRRACSSSESLVRLVKAEINGACASGAGPLARAQCVASKATARLKGRVVDSRGHRSGPVISKPRFEKRGVEGMCSA